jgi:uncharacterized lipoprotein YehR (DUF1307 family)
LLGLPYNKNNMKKILITALVLAAAMTSCTDAEKSKLGGYGDTFTVKVLGPDTVITYHSTGKVISEDKSDGYYFTNAATGKLVEVSGNVIIEQE